ncbi:MAG: NADH-quinone oxidoreductase subunit NuoF [Corynebacterium sp.]|nr:NADH-quinone oxidoreductase subunit NuoF [Corynebacterium sp.]
MTAALKLTPILSTNWGDAQPWTLEGYRQRGGYKALEKALTMEPGDLITLVKDSGLRGRGGAGFPVGMKWSFVPQDNPKPKYLVINGDESEPGTCKDIPLLMATPHTLIEGALIASYAFGAQEAFLFLRGEVVHVARRMQAAIEEAYAAGLAGDNVMGTGKRLHIHVHSGAGAYICGEETALLNALEGKRGHPRLRPPFPAVEGLYSSPTVINNVESISAVPSIVRHGAAWYQNMGTEGSKGATIYSLSGHVKNPGQYECEMGVTLRELLEMAGGIRDGHELKFWTPGGSSTQMFTADHLDVPLDYEEVRNNGSLLGTKALQIFDDTVSVVRTTTRFIEFYKHESCGKCTPCREGTYWMVYLLQRLERGEGQPGDVDKLLELAGNIGGKSFCALADGAVACVTAAIEHFREEFEAGYHTPAWELFPYENTVIFSEKEMVHD